MNTSDAIMDSLLVRVKRRSALSVSCLEFLVSSFRFHIVRKHLRKLETRNLQLETLERDTLHTSRITGIENATGGLSRYGG
jgi:hypothetical protein